MNKVKCPWCGNKGTDYISPSGYGVLNIDPKPIKWESCATCRPIVSAMRDNRDVKVVS